MAGPVVKRSSVVGVFRSRGRSDSPSGSRHMYPERRAKTGSELDIRNPTQNVQPKRDKALHFMCLLLWRIICAVGLPLHRGRQPCLGVVGRNLHSSLEENNYGDLLRTSAGVEGAEVRPTSQISIRLITSAYTTAL